jgi:uncharacterized membrane protein YgcG
MTRARALLLALAGLLLPVGLALGVYLTSAGSLAAVPQVIEPPDQIARSAATTETVGTTTTGPETTPTETTGGDDDDRGDDLPGKCKDPDHQLDPDCDPRTAEDDDDDSSGPGSGSDGGSSGHGGGGDSSGPGSGDD